MAKEQNQKPEEDEDVHGSQTDEGAADDGDDDDDEPESQPEAAARSDQQRPSRKERRSERWRLRQQEYEDLRQFKQRTEPVLAEYNTLKERLARIEQEREARGTEEKQAKTQQEFDKKIGEIEGAIQRELMLASQQGEKWDPSNYNKLQRQLRQAEFDQWAKASQAQQQPQQPAQSPQVQRDQLILTAEYPWLDDSALANAAGSYYHYLVTAEGMAQGLETKRAACAHIASVKKLGGNVRRGGTAAWGRAPTGQARDGEGNGEDWTDDERKFVAPGLRGKSKKEIDRLAREAENPE